MTKKRCQWRLFVDDIRLVPEGWTIARTITSAISLLNKYAWDIVSVDHDIQGSPDENFTPVVEFITRLPKSQRPKVACHSGNPCAYDKYSDLLKSVGDELYLFDDLEDE